MVFTKKKRKVCTKVLTAVKTRKRHFALVTKKKSTNNSIYFIDPEDKYLYVLNCALLYKYDNTSIGKIALYKFNKIVNYYLINNNIKIWNKDLQNIIYKFL